MACILVDKDYACLVPISGIKKGQRYKLEMNKPEIFSTDISIVGVDVDKYGFFDPNGEYIAYETI